MFLEKIEMENSNHVCCKVYSFILDSCRANTRTTDSHDYVDFYTNPLVKIREYIKEDIAVYFVIEIDGNRTRRRYSEFDTLHRYLNSEYPEFIIPSIGEKHMIKHLMRQDLDDEFYSERKIMLEIFCNRLLEHNQLNQDHRFHEFLVDNKDLDGRETAQNGGSGGFQSLTEDELSEQIVLQKHQYLEIQNDCEAEDKKILPNEKHAFLFSFKKNNDRIIFLVKSLDGYIKRYYKEEHTLFLENKRVNGFITTYLNTQMECLDDECSLLVDNLNEGGSDTTSGYMDMLVSLRKTYDCMKCPNSNPKTTREVYFRLKELLLYSHCTERLYKHRRCLLSQYFKSKDKSRSHDKAENGQDSTEKTMESRIQEYDKIMESELLTYERKRDLNLQHIIQTFAQSEYLYHKNYVDAIQKSTQLG